MDVEGTISIILNVGEIVVTTRKIEWQLWINYDEGKMTLNSFNYSSYYFVFNLMLSFS